MLGSEAASAAGALTAVLQRIAEFELRPKAIPRLLHPVVRQRVPHRGIQAPGTPDVRHRRLCVRLTPPPAQADRERVPLAARDRVPRVNVGAVPDQRLGSAGSRGQGGQNDDKVGR
jgi:hypothetical protein